MPGTFETLREPKKMYMQERVWVTSESWSDSGKQNQTSEPKIPSWVFNISANAEFQDLVYIGKPWLLAPKGSISQNGWQMEKIIKFHPVFCTIKIDSRHNGLTLNFAGQRHIKIKRESAFRSWIINQHTVWSWAARARGIRACRLSTWLVP